MNDRIIVPKPEPRPRPGRKPEFDFRSMKPRDVKLFECHISIVKKKLDYFIYARKSFDPWYYLAYDTVDRNNYSICYIYRALDYEDRQKVDKLEGRERFNFFADYFSRTEPISTLENLKARYAAEGRQWPPVE